jgi:hypothetical protein
VGAAESSVAANGITISHPTTGWYRVSFDQALGISSSSMYPIERHWVSTPT